MEFLYIKRGRTYLQWLAMMTFSGRHAAAIYELPVVCVVCTPNIIIILFFELNGA